MTEEESRFFSTTVSVRMGDADLTNRAYLSRFFEWSHQAFEDLMVAADDRLDRAFAEEGWGMPLVHADATLEGSAEFAETLEVHLRVERIGTRSLTLSFQFVNLQGVPIADTRLIHTFAQLDGLKESIEVPNRLLNVFRRLNLIGPL